MCGTYAAVDTHRLLLFLADLDLTILHHLGAACTFPYGAPHHHVRLRWASPRPRAVQTPSVGGERLPGCLTTHPRTPPPLSSPPRTPRRTAQRARTGVPSTALPAESTEPPPPSNLRTRPLWESVLSRRAAAIRFTGWVGFFWSTVPHRPISLINAADSVHGPPRDTGCVRIL